jgi:hypothetical protein
MESYFRKLFTLLHEEKAADESKHSSLEVNDDDCIESKVTYYSFKHFIEPGMLVNIYSLVDFWLVELCTHHKKSLQLSCDIRYIKDESKLSTRHNYLTTYAALNLSDITHSYQRLEDLRLVRNQFIHDGGHVSKDREKQFLLIEGISLCSGLIVIQDGFVWSLLDHAGRYLRAAALAKR